MLDLLIMLMILITFPGIMLIIATIVILGSVYVFGELNTDIPLGHASSKFGIAT